MENAGSESGAGAACSDSLADMFGVAGAAAGDDGYGDGVGDRAGNFEIIAIFGAVGIHAGEDNFSGSELFDAAGPFDGMKSSGNSAAIDVHIPDFVAVATDAFGIDIDDDALAAEAEGGFANEVGVADGCGIDGNFVATGLEESADIFECADTAADSERHEDDFRGACDDIEDDTALFVAGSDIEEDEFVGALLFVAAGNFDGITRVLQIHKIHSLHDASGVNIKAGNDTLCEHVWEIRGIGGKCSRGEAGVSSGDPYLTILSCVFQLQRPTFGDLQTEQKEIIL
jgi:hypothetical protein